MQSSKKSKYQFLNIHFSFLCKNREEKFKDKPYNDKDKFMSTKQINADKEVYHGMG